jgi:hypothetical protein
VIEHDNARVSVGKLTLVTTLREESDGARIRVCQCPDALNQRIRIAAKLATESNSEFPQRNGHDFDATVA